MFVYIAAFVAFVETCVGLAMIPWVWRNWNSRSEDKSKLLALFGFMLTFSGVGLAILLIGGKLQ